MAHRIARTLGLALAGAMVVLATPLMSDAACLARASGVCVHPGAACHPPQPGACQTVARPIPGPARARLSLQDARKADPAALGSSD